jgi:hypothetical protein
MPTAGNRDEINADGMQNSGVEFLDGGRQQQVRGSGAGLPRGDPNSLAQPWT